MRYVLILVLIGFSALTVQALMDHGYIGLILWHFTSTAGMQVIADLVLACLMASYWMYRDAEASGRNPWGYIALTLVLGSFGPLLYLLVGAFLQKDSQPQLA